MLVLISFKIHTKKCFEVFDVIARSAFTGDIVGKKGWGRLIDETFGNETFKNLAEIDVSFDNVEKLKEFINALEVKQK